MMPSEFYDQRKWREIHRQADELIFTKSGHCLAAIYHSPDERLRQDRARFIDMLREWALTLPTEDS